MRADRIEISTNALRGVASEALAADRTSGYRVEAIDLGDELRAHGSAVGTGYAALARGASASSSPLGSWDVRLTLPDREVDSHGDVVSLLGV